jgi:hypothetical protein
MPYNRFYVLCNFIYLLLFDCVFLCSQNKRECCFGTLTVPEGTRQYLCNKNFSLLSNNIINKTSCLVNQTLVLLSTPLAMGARGQTFGTESFQS